MIEGVCHCGGVRWSFEGVPDSVTSCSCTICRRYGALWAYDFDNEKIKVSGTTTVYAWRGQWLGLPLLRPLRLRCLLATNTAGRGGPASSRG
ncbi:MAG: hypothetical protein RL685_673 [Pseudomonadota bacterium]|jgi:hypothetical protein